jgi:hypothetical protein
VKATSPGVAREPFGKRCGSTSTAEEASSLWPKQAMRALDTATDQSRALRKRLLHVECQASGRKYAYAGIDSSPQDYPAPRLLKSDAAVTDPLARLRTRLNPFSEEEQGHLINWGWYVMDLAMRSYAVSGEAALRRGHCLIGRRSKFGVPQSRGAATGRRTRRHERSRKYRKQPHAK